MADRFFMRFNLQNSVAHYPATAEVFGALFSEEKEAAQEILADFEAIQSRRIAALTEKHGDALTYLHGKRVLFLGDSITSDNLGYRVSVTRAARLCAEDGAISGGTSATILYSTMRKLREKKPELVSLMIGCNDSMSVEREGLQQVSPEEYERNLRAMLGWVAESGAKLLLFEVSPIREDCFAHHSMDKGKRQSADNIARYNEILRNLAGEWGITVIPHAWIRTEEDKERYIERDGVHFTVEGQEAFSDYWLSQAISLYNT